MVNVWILAPSPGDEQVSLLELCHRLGVSESTARGWVRRGLLPEPARLGYRTTRFSWNNCLARLQSRTIP
jgi:predicted DNA-binding transcriptional regulator AlpA